MPRAAIPTLDALDLTLDVSGWTVLRLDGRGFTKGARAYARPFDPRFHEAMRTATEALMAATPASFAHTASDEISVGFAPDTDWFGAGLSKWLTTAAGVTSAALARAMAEFDGLPSVDARAFASTDADGVADYVFERFHSSWRNCRQGYAHYGLLERGLSPRMAEAAQQAMSPDEVTAFVPADVPTWQRHGAVAFYQNVPHVGHNPITGQDVTTVRRHLIWGEAATFDALAELLPRVLRSRPSRRAAA